MPFNALDFTLQSRLNLDTRHSTSYNLGPGKRALGTRLDQLELNPYNLVKLPKKLNIDLCQFFFFFIERRHCSYKNHEIKTRGHRTGFGGRAEESARKLHFLRFLREEWGEFQNGSYVEGGRRLFFGPFVCLFFFFSKTFSFFDRLKIYQ